MTVTQEGERSQPLGPSTVQAATLTKRETALDLRSFMRRPPGAPAAAQLKPAAVQAEPVRTQAKATEAPQRDASIAFSLLDQAATALPALLERCRKLGADLDAAESSTREWQQNAATLKLKLEAAETSLEAMRLRTAAAEAQAAEAEGLSTLLHDKVMTALGLGSAAHGAFDALQTQCLPASVK